MASSATGSLVTNSLVTKRTGGGAGAPGRVLMVGANLDSRYGGISSMVRQLCPVAEEEGDLTITLAAFARPDENLDTLAAIAPLRRYPLRGWTSFLRSNEALREQVEAADVVHIHGIWQEHCAEAVGWARRLGKPYIVSAHGMLDGWALREKRWKKAAALQLRERRHLRNASVLHALTAAEGRDYKAVTRHVPVNVIPNAVTLPDKVNPNLFRQEYPEVRGKNVILFLSRLHPKKGLDLLAEAWKRVAADAPDAHLVIAGPDDGVQDHIASMFSAARIAHRVTFTGMLTGPMKWSALAAADLFVLPSRSEGLSMAALEAMGMGIPVILTEQCHVDGVTGARCGWQIQPEARELEGALREFLRRPEAVASISANARNLVRDRYSWSAVGSQYRSLYRAQIARHSRTYRIQ